MIINFGSMVIAFFGAPSMISRDFAEYLATQFGETYAFGSYHFSIKRL